MFRKKKGQSTLEYILLLTLVIGGVIAGITILANKGRRDTGVGKVLNASIGKIDKVADQIANINP